MQKDKPYLQHLTKADDLKTTYEKTRAGFVALALEKNRQATPFVEQARALKVSASQAKSPRELMAIKEIQPALLTASGVSDKAAGHLLPEDKIIAIKGLIENYLEPAGNSFVEELVYRFLLTRGDTLGGSMRNIGGILAQRKLTRAIISSLALSETSYYWLDSNSNTWVHSSKEIADIELFLKGLSWIKNGRKRTVMYNLTVPIVKKNIDLCFLNCDYQEFPKIYKNPLVYIALGELKGGIDPAGADEHWKTASTAFSRIDKAFSKNKLNPYKFFVGASIELAMAKEIWAQLKKGILANAANLTDENQVASLCGWLSIL